MSYASEVAADSPKAYFRMQEASGLIQDSSGLAHHATGSTGTATYQQASPMTSDPSDFSIDFNADNFSIPDHADLTFGNTLTVEAWVYKGDSGVTRAIMGRGSGALTLGTFTDDKLFAAKADFSVICFSTIALSVSNWHHVAYTKASTASNLYINGVDRTDTVTDATFTNPAIPLIVGADYNGTIGWVGKMDEVAFYATALSQARIQAHYDASFTVTPAGDLRVVRSALRW
jgi:hypothetical protein